MKKDFQTLSVLFLLGLLLSFSACTPESYGNPPKDLSVSELVGVWEVRYGKDRIDRITIREDGLYQQTYENKSIDYRFETGWYPLRLETVSNGNIYAHFEKGRYYAAGEQIAELDGMKCPPELPDCNFGTRRRQFYDPYLSSDVQMVKELVLTIRVDTNGEVIFHHMWTSSDRGFAIIGGERDIFQHMNDQSGEQNR